MLENFREFIVILLSALGVLYLYKSLLVFLLRNRYDTEIYIIIPLNDTCENVEQVIRSSAERCELMGKNRWEKVICVDYGCDEEKKEMIFRLCNEYSFLEYITVSEFTKKFLYQKKYKK